MEMRGKDKNCQGHILQLERVTIIDAQIIALGVSGALLGLLDIEFCMTLETSSLEVQEVFCVCLALCSA